MFCYQCQETKKNHGCDTHRGMCGKTEHTANLQDLLVYTLGGIALCTEEMQISPTQNQGIFITEALFATMTNVNFDNTAIATLIKKALRIRNTLRRQLPHKTSHNAIWWEGSTDADFLEKATSIGTASYSNDPDVLSLKTLLLYGIKGIAAYAEHAAVFKAYDTCIYAFITKTLAAILKNTTEAILLDLISEAGSVAVTTMALLDNAHSNHYGHPEITHVSLATKKNPGVLISGHDLHDMAALLEQSQDTGVDIYTHGEMLPAHYYPAFKKYIHLAGNYGNAWWQQQEEFTSFNGPIIMTSNCIVPVKDAYKDRLFTTGIVRYPGTQHIDTRLPNGQRDFSVIIALAKTCAPPQEIESGEIVGGFGHHQLLALADKIIDAVQSGRIKRFIVMAGCDGRHPSREYFTHVAQNLPDNTVILTAGCAKYRYNKLDLGDIDGIPRVLDAGQCNDSYGLALIALKLKKIFDVDDINALPLSFDIAWYEQKAIAVLLGLLHLGFKGIRLGPTLPAFLSKNVANVLVNSFDIKPIDTVKDDIEAMMEGK